MLVEPDARAGFDQDGCERGLADLKRVTAQVVAVQLDQVEGDRFHCEAPGGLAGRLVVRGARCLARRVLCLADTTAQSAQPKR